MHNLYRVHAEADAQTLPRILDLFAQRDVLPTRVTANTQGPILQVMVEVPAMDGASRDLITEKIRQMLLVSDVQCVTQAIGI